MGLPEAFLPNGFPLADEKNTCILQENLVELVRHAGAQALHHKNGIIETKTEHCVRIYFRKRGFIL